MIDMVLSLSGRSGELLNKLSEIRKTSKDKIIEQLIEEALEDELERKDAEVALKEFEANPVTYSMSEIETELGL